jgi:hypothetical protein
MTTRTYTGEPADLGQLSQDVKLWFMQSDFETQLASEQGTWVIQARKTGVVRTITGMNQAFIVKVSGSPDSFTVDVGTGKWVENLAGAGIASIFAGGITLLTGAIGIAWVKKLENDFWNWLEDHRRFGRRSAATAPTAIQAPPPPSNVGIPEQIEKLAKLKDQGILSKEEFDAKKKELLARM